MYCDVVNVQPRFNFPDKIIILNYCLLQNCVERGGGGGGGGGGEKKKERKKERLSDWERRGQQRL